MSATTYPHLFTPARIGSVELKNRLVMLPMGSRMITDGLVNERDSRYHEERAKGGVGLIITGGTVVHPTSLVRMKILIEGWDPDNVEPMRARVDAMHAHGAKVFGQFLHLGREAPDGQSDQAPLAPSPIPSPRDPYIPHEMDRDEIEMIIRAFGDTAAIHVAAGYDGLEVHAAHGYLIPQFLSRASNQRGDHYGSRSWDDRTRFLRDCVAAVRERVPDDMPVGVRLSCDEETPDGLTVDDTLQIVERLEATGQVSYLSLTVGMRNAYVKDTFTPEAVALDRAAKVKAATDLPVIVAGRFRTPDLAEEALASGAVDFVGMGRALIADPELPNKAREGGAPIRPCIGIVQDCRLAQGGLTCAVNQAAGRELEWGGTEAEPASTRRSVLVVGGGPAGLEAARVCATRGHQVRLVERDQTLGGQLRWAAAAPGRAEMADWIRYAEAELERLGVQVETGVTADPDLVLGAGADAVIVATGSAPPLPRLEGEPAVELIRVIDLLADADRWASGRGRALVMDDGGGFWPGVSAAELLAQHGWDVQLATPARAVGLAIPHESIGGLLTRLRRGGVQFRSMVDLVGLDGRTAQLADVITGERQTLDVDLVVAQTRGVVVDDLLTALTGRTDGHGPEVHAIGDCRSPRRLTHAVLEANEVARTLG